MRFILFSITLIFAGLHALAQETDSTDIKQYHLFNPVPRNQMRDFSIDRPDVTESPISVDADTFNLKAIYTNGQKPRREPVDAWLMYLTDYIKWGFLIRGIFTLA